ncbi:hypothetical protein ACFQYP_43360 [Nonomuraea antimicrobica]
MDTAPHLDTAPHRLGLERVVEVFSGHDDHVGVTGSGYAIGADLVLTSGQVVAPGVPCHVRPAGSARWLRAEPVWRGRGDAVLLRAAEPAWASSPGVEHTRWARVAASGDQRVRCVARGFEQAGRRAGSRAAEPVSGLVETPTGAVTTALTASLPGREPDGMPISLWRGLSGAALLAEPAGQIVGVVTPSPAGYAERRLDAVPVSALLVDERFRELVGVPPGCLETVAEDGSRVPLPGLLTPAREPLPEDRADWTVLMARHAVVPFLGRDEELGELRSWAAGPDTLSIALSIAVVTGRAGIGKSRLAGELCAELAAAGWDTRFLPLDTVCGLLSRNVRLDAPRPTLVVVDRPEGSSPLVGELIRHLAEHGHNPRVRLLLLVREPGEMDWWRRLDTAAGGRLRRLNTTTVPLNAHPLTLAERGEHALAAMKAYAPSRAALPAPPRLDDPEYGLPLHVHLAALLRLHDANGEEPGASGARGHDAKENAAAPGDSVPGGSGGAAAVRGGLLGRFVAREWDQWARVWPDGEERLGDVTARRAVAVLALTAPTPAELPGLLTTVPGIRNRTPTTPAPDTGATVGDRTASSAVSVARWLGRVFAGPPEPPGSPAVTGLPGALGRRGERLASLGPDLVAEQFLGEVEDLDALVLAVHDHEGRTTGHLVRMLDVLRRSVGAERARSALWSLIASRTGRLVAEAVANPGTRLGDVLDAAFRSFSDDRQLAEAVAALPMLPPHATRPDPREGGSALQEALRTDDLGPQEGRLGLGAGGLGLRALNVTLAELAVRHRHGTGERLASAGALTWLSGALTAAGRVGEAVVAAAQAVDVYAGAPPYEEAAGRAEALFGLAACLLLGGEAEGALKPAQEAAARFRVLAEDDPRYGERAARAQYNVACALLGSGRLGAAVAAFEAAGGDGAFAAHVSGVLAVVPEDAGVGPRSPARDEARPSGGSRGDRRVFPPTPVAGESGWGSPDDHPTPPIRDVLGLGPSAPVAGGARAFADERLPCRLRTPPLNDLHRTRLRRRPLRPGRTTFSRPRSWCREAGRGGRQASRHLCRSPTR